MKSGRKSLSKRFLNSGCLIGPAIIPHAEWNTLNSIRRGKVLEYVLSASGGP